MSQLGKAGEVRLHVPGSCQKSVLELGRNDECVVCEPITWLVFTGLLLVYLHYKETGLKRINSLPKTQWGAESKASPLPCPDRNDNEDEWGFGTELPGLSVRQRGAAERRALSPGAGEVP